MAVQAAAVRWAFLIAAFLPLAGPARADHLHSLHNCDVWLRHCEVDRAQQFLFQTEDAFRRAQLDVDAASASRDAAAADERRLSDSLGAAYSEIDRLRVELSRAETDLKRLEENARRAGTTADQSRRDVDALRPELEAAQKALDAAADEAVAAFEAGEPMQTVVARLRDAEVALNRAEIACVDSLSQTNAFRQAQDEAQESEAKLNALRDQKPRDDAAVATASKEWIDAKRRVNDLIEAAKDADPAVATAKGDLNGARDEIARLRKQFERSLSQDSRVATAQKALDDAREPYESAVKAAEAAEARVQLTQQALDERTATSDGLRKDLAKVEDDVERFDGELDRVRNALAGADDQVSQALAHLDHVRADRESAVIALRHAEASERIAVCSFVIIRQPVFGGRHDHDRDHDRDWRRDRDHDRDWDRDRDRDRSRSNDDRDNTRRPRVDGEPVGRPRRAGASTQPAAGGGSVVASPTIRTPLANPQQDGIRQPRIDTRRVDDLVARQRLIAQRAAEREKATQQRRQAPSARVVEPTPISVPPVVITPTPAVAERERDARARERQRESEARTANAKMTAVGVREAAAERERQAQAKQASVSAERQQQREQSRAAEAAKEQSRRTEQAGQERANRQREAQRDAQRQQERESRQTADRERQSQRDAEQQRDAAARESRRDQAEQQKQERREAKRQDDNGSKRKSRR
jgi:hypothetical protein